MYEFGSFRLDPIRRLLYRNGEITALTPKALDTLLVLVKNSGRAVGKEELIQAVWPDTFVEEANLTQAISTVRKVLGESPTDHAYIETVPRHGYRFVAVVREHKPGPRLSPRRPLLVAAVLLALLVGTTISILLIRRSQADFPVSSMAAVPLTSYPGIELHPTFSPDGNHVGFAWNGAGQDNFDIYVKLIGEERPLRLTHHPARDFRPAWSPDGRFIAFLREIGNGQAEVLAVPSIGGLERKVADVHPGYFGNYHSTPYLNWTADGKWLITTDTGASVRAARLVLISLETGEKKRLTSPPEHLIGDVTAAVSNDGRTLAFSRMEGGNLGRLCLLMLSGDLATAGEPDCFAVGGERFGGIRSFAWTPDGREIVFSSPFLGSRQSLWRMALTPRPGRAGAPQRLPTASESSTDPVISRNGRRLAYSNLIINPDIWRLELPNVSHKVAGRPVGAVKLITSTQADVGPQYSPDGERIAFISRRSGTPEVWVTAKDGSDATRLTSLGAPLTGAPRWSPDGRRIVFDSTLEGQFELYLINADGGGLRRLTHHPAADAAASWSRDGNWIYFLSTRTGRHEVWKTPANGAEAEAIQLTKQGGGAAFDSPDGKFVYYDKDEAGGASLWRTPAAGGEEVKVLDSVLGLRFAVVDSGLYFIEPTVGGPVIRFLRFKTGEITSIAQVDGLVQGGLSVSPDGRFLLYSLGELVGSDLVLVDHFR